MVFDSSVSKLTLTAEMVVVDGGQVWVGSEDCPYPSFAEFVLTGSPSTLPPPSKKVYNVFSSFLLPFGKIDGWLASWSWLGK